MAEQNHDSRSEIAIQKSTLRRLPTYYSYLIQKLSKDDAYISAAKLAEAVSLNPVLVRKDIASISSQPGKPKVGFAVAQLVHDMESFLGYNRYDAAILVGVGSLGKALLSYDRFSNYGIEIIAAFDSVEGMTGIKVNGTMIFPMSKLSNIIHRLKVSIGIIAVPKENAQEVCDQLVLAGIKGIWNFSPTFLDVPDNVIVRNEDLALSLSSLIYDLKAADPMQ